MAQTPEGVVKDKIKKILDSYKGYLYYEMKVPTGYGSPSLDYFGAARTASGCGHSFAIEAKRPGKRPTTRQEATMERMQEGGIQVFVIVDDEGCAALDQWLDTTTAGTTL